MLNLCVDVSIDGDKLWELQYGVTNLCLKSSPLVKGAKRAEAKRNKSLQMSYEQFCRLRATEWTLKPQSHRTSVISVGDKNVCDHTIRELEPLNKSLTIWVSYLYLPTFPECMTALATYFYAFLLRCCRLWGNGKTLDCTCQTSLSKVHSPHVSARLLLPISGMHRLQAA